MELRLQGIGKRFGREWVLRDLDLDLPEGSHTAILGSNGSGKSTLLKIIAGYLTPSKGTIEHLSVEKEKLYKELSIVAPYLDLYRDLDLDQCVDFHFSLRDFQEGMDKGQLKELMQLPTGRPIASYSSGMVQRLKIGLALATRSSLLLLDEASMNLDKASVDWYVEALKAYVGGRTVVVASNVEGKETETCTRSFRIEEKTLRPV
jgi:ABC-type multidrug transport system ATPase subunit